ncbi:MAG TPA: ABC transporter ATP-binding protein [Proteobacteria bacterium]|nr:ABC transporter ATP-binding protein [Pseudomonadota bacterium]
MKRGEVVLEHVSHAYPGSDGAVSVIDNLHVTIAPGELFCVLGPSGCGKTTLLKLIAGFAKPTGGRILVSGEKVTGPGPERALVFQQPQLFPWLTVAANIERGLRRRFHQTAPRRKKLVELLDLIGLEAFADHYPHQLSGGMQQRVALARALALEPEVLLLDEPFTALDQLIRERLQDELLRLNRELGRTMLFVTHNTQEAAYLGNRIMVLSQGPARVTRLLRIPLPHPRRRGDEKLWRLERELYLHCGCCSETPDLYLIPANSSEGQSP